MNNRVQCLINLDKYPYYYDHNLNTIKSVSTTREGFCPFPSSLEEENSVFPQKRNHHIFYLAYRAAERGDYNIDLPSAGSRTLRPQ